MDGPSGKDQGARPAGQPGTARRVLRRATQWASDYARLPGIPDGAPAW